jgi:Ni,Fe-hydrogenase III large subunit
MQFMRLKEDWLRLNASLFGHRLLMDRIVPGGVAVDLDDAGAAPSRPMRRARSAKCARSRPSTTSTPDCRTAS